MATSTAQEKAFEMSQKLLRLKTKRPNLFRLFWALICYFEGLREGE